MSSVRKHLLYLAEGGYFTHRGWRIVYNDKSHGNPRAVFRKGTKDQKRTINWLWVP